MAELWHSIWGSLNPILLFKTDIHSCNPCMIMQGVWRTCKFHCNLQAAIAFVKCILGRLRLVRGQRLSYFSVASGTNILKKSFKTRSLARLRRWCPAGRRLLVWNSFPLSGCCGCVETITVWLTADQLETLILYCQPAEVGPETAPS